MFCDRLMMQSIRQSVQNGQFLSRLVQDASDLFVASHADKRIERLLVHVAIAAKIALETAGTIAEVPHSPGRTRSVPASPDREGAVDQRLVIAR